MHFSFRQRYWVWLGLFLLQCLVVGCQRRTRDETEQITKRLNQKSLQTDSLRQGMRYLAQTTPLNRANLSSEVRILLNAWLKTSDATKTTYAASSLLSALDPKALKLVGCDSAVATQFSPTDVDYLFECMLMKRLSDWIVRGPIHDRVFQSSLSAKMSSLEAAEASKLEQTYKLFDWTIRNIALSGHESSQVQIKSSDPRLPLVENGVGYAYLPWESTFFCGGDFVVRGRVFSALARQQGIDTCWLSVGAQAGQPGELWAMGVLVGKRILLLDPKLGLPILDPDNDAWTTVQDATTNARILRRLSLPQYAYPFDSSSILNVQILIDAVPFAASQRAALLQASLLGEERMTVAVDLQSLADRLGKEAPNAVVSLWHVPLLAQLYAEDKREKLSQITEYTMRYMAEHAIWLLDNPVSTGRILHLGGQFENSLEQTGALKTYINARVDDESLRRLAYNPDVQKAMGLFRSDQETKEQFDARVRQVQFLFGRSKFDVAFLLAQLHYDRGDYESTVYWLKERVLSDPRAAQWHAAGWYLLGRALTQLEKYDEAQEALTLPAAEQAGSQPGYAVNPQDAGNRLRLRYLRKLIAPEQADLAQVANVTIP